MPDSTALLVSRSASVISAVKGASASVAHLRVEVCPGSEHACERVCRQDVVLVLAHLLPGGESPVTRLLWTVADASRPCATLVLSDSYRDHQVGALLRAGAADYLELPADLPRLTHLLDVLTRRFRSPAGNGTADEALDEADPLDGIVSGGLERLMAQVRRVAPQDTTLLLTGDTGTGKTRLARLIHDLSPRRKEPFLVVDCGTLSPALIESELFGHARGAFTGADRERVGKLAAAGAGTLLLDEINSLPVALQGKLLRAADERLFEPVGSERPMPVRARLIAASNVSLEEEVSAGKFRPDLFYRLNVVSFFLPPLRERRGSIATLAQRFLGEFAGRNRPDVTGYDSTALQALQGYDWPGNIRELRNVVERAVALCPGPEVCPADLPEMIRECEAVLSWAPAPAGPALMSASPTFTLHQSKEEVEVRRILETLAKHNNNRLRAAAELGISRVGLYKKLHKYGLIQPKGRS